MSWLFKVISRTVSFQDPNAGWKLSMDHEDELLEKIACLLFVFHKKKQDNQVWLSTNSKNQRP